MRVWSRPRSTRETRGTFVLGRISTKYGCRIRVELLSYANIVTRGVTGRGHVDISVKWREMNFLTVVYEIEVSCTVLRFGS
jgi:hypothetical protein